MFSKLTQRILLAVLVLVVSGFACATADGACWSRVYQARETVSSEQLDNMARADEDYDVLRGVVNNPNTRLSTLVRMALDSATSFKELDPSEGLTVGWLAAFRALELVDARSIRELYGFAYARNAQVRAAYASATPNTETISWLAYDKDAQVRTGAALNGHTPESVLDYLSYDTSTQVREALPEFWRYWRRIPDQKNPAAPRYIAQHAVGVTGDRYTLWFNLAKSSKSAPIPVQYDITCLGHTFKQVGTVRAKAAPPGSSWYKIIEHVCTSYKTPF